MYASSFIVMTGVIEYRDTNTFDIVHHNFFHGVYAFTIVYLCVTTMLLVQRHRILCSFSPGCEGCSSRNEGGEI